MKLLSPLPFLASIIGIIPATSSLATYSTSSGGPSYSVGISASNSNNVYFQLAAPTSYQWVALGIGSQMSGSTIFLMYADGSGNVTLSPRKGTGHVEPKYDSSMTVKLLAGSGIVDGNMVANVLCTSCSSKLASTTSTSSNWIAAWNSGSALDTTDTSKSISQHSGSNHRSFTFDLSQAQLESDSNPFTSASSATTSSPSGASSSSSSSSTSSGTSRVQSYDMAHGIIMGVTVVLLFPLGALSMRIFGRPWLHASLQIISFIFLIAGLGLGIKLAGLRYGSFGPNLARRTVIDEIAKRQFGAFGSSTFTGTPPWATATGTNTGGFNNPTSTSDSGSGSNSGSGSGAASQGSGNAAITGASVTPNLGTIITNTTHMIFGIILVVLFFIQPFLGLIHHWRYMRAQRRGMFGYIHLWYGRILIVLAVINGGLGLQLASNTKNGEIAYGVIAAFIGLFYIGVVVFTAVRKRRRNREWSKTF
ncbi:ec1f3bee-01cb-4581-a17e-a99199bf1008 [Sclerotinia trifoliorum]|uniref:Ec1f3bee-01cb-4581-a17e-a99199bf1008 n=1 Tax=Sclerotinia trifoliorum TaxID=28548 RepID=A0A8H2VM39_9HELO|nr:ec1f3bee-01cb-4581-a17e-a99199bf1008 [Sclerotinia trifoliorum]